MKELQTVTVKIEVDTSEFIEAWQNLSDAMVDVANRLMTWSTGLVEDLFVDTHDIARSDIKKVVCEGKEWYAYLYNGRKIKLDVRKI